MIGGVIRGHDCGVSMMPELPEVETIRRGIRPLVRGRVLRRVEMRRRDLRRRLPVDFPQRLTGQPVLEVERRGKYILMPLASGETLLIHFGMSGRLLARPDWPQNVARHDHILMQIADGCTLVFNDPRRFGLMALAVRDGLETHPLLAFLGPDPLSRRFNGAYLRTALRGRRGAVKTVLLDQSLGAGVGNIYACEALHQARLSPLCPACSLSAVQSQRLVGALKNVLRAAIRAGGSSLRDHRRPDGSLGYFHHDFAVYGRAGVSCRRGCGGVIMRIVQAGRATFYCPVCQQ